MVSSVAAHGGDGTDEEAGERQDMTAEVGDHAAAARSAAAPVHRRVRTGHIVLGMDAAKVGYLADLAAGDDLARQGLDRVLQVVEADHGDDAGLGGAGGQTARLGGGHRQGLLAIDVLAGGECRDRDFPMLGRGRRDVDDVNRRIVHELPPVAGGAPEAELAGGRGRCPLVDLRDQFQHGCRRKIEDGADLPIGDRVRTAHEPGADQADADLAH